MKIHFALATIVALGGAAWAAGCGGSDETHGGLGGGGADSTGTHHHPDGSGGNTGGGTFASGVGGHSGCNTTHCSADLHDVLDCNNKVVKTCPASQGCGKDGCVPACEAAKDNKSSIGCDFYVVEPDSLTPGSCFAAFVANTWETPVKIQVERGGTPLDISHAAFTTTGTGHNLVYTPLVNSTVPVGEVAILFLSHSGGVACPGGVTPALVGDAALHATGYGQALHVTVDAPTVAYDIFPYGGGEAAETSATLLLPTSAWDVNYVAVDAWEFSTAAGTSPTVDIVALEDGTEVTINPSAAIVGGGGVPAAAANTMVTYNLTKGQLIHFGQNAELIGSPIESNKPVGVWGGHQCMNIEASIRYCDASHQQIPPVKALGNEYVAVRYRNRYANNEESPPWRIVGAVDGTMLTYEPAAPPGAPTTLNLGEHIKFNASGPFVVKSQDKDHPFYMSAHMSGCSPFDPGTLSDCRGDPEFVNVLPPAQYLDSYVFFADPTYPETNLVVVRKKDAGAFSDVTLDCAGVLTGWMPADASGNYEYTRIDLSTGNFAAANGCNTGRHEIHSPVPFGLTVWGWGSGVTGSGSGSGFYSQAVSYAYPAGASVQPINTVKVPVTPK